MDIVVIRNDITTLEVDAVVRPSSERGPAAQAVSEKILERGGSPVSQALSSLRPPRIGEAVMTPGGQLPCRFVIHSPVQPDSSGVPTLDNIKKGILAAIRCAEDHQLRSIAMPNMGLEGDAGTRTRAARAILAMLAGFQTRQLSRILLVDNDEITLRAYESALEAFRE